MSPSISTPAILAAASLSMGTMGCKARAFNSDASDTRGTAGIPSGLPVPVGVDAKLLTNLAAPEANPQAGMTSDAIVDLPNGKVFVSLRRADGRTLGEMGKAASPFDKPWNVLDYEKILAKAHGADSKVAAPGPFAGAAVLNVLLKNRKTFGRKVEGGADNVPDLLGERAFMESLPQRHPVLPINYETADPSRPFLSTSCGAYDPNDYGDVRWHYYCQVPGFFRACQRVLVGRLYDTKSAEFSDKFTKGELGPEQYALAANRLRREDEEAVRSYCLDPAGFADAGTKSIYDAVTQGKESEWKMPPGSIARLFQTFHASQKDEATGVNMYDYIMRSGLYAWDFTQQHAVLNTFYGSLKPAGEKTFDPADPNDCKTYRDSRVRIESLLGQSGAHCLATGLRAEPFFVLPVGTRP